MTSEEPLPDRCGAECRDGGYCTQYPVQESERCRMHGGSSPKGEDHPSFKHGAYSKLLRSDLSDREREAMDDLVGDLEDEEASLDVVREMAAEAALKYKRCGDHRFLREFRQLVSEFNLAPNEDHVELQAEVESEHSLDDETREAVREVLSHRREASNE